MTRMPAGLAGKVVGWQEAHGRHGLPWQQTRDPYRVWLSEIMLQQTQVATVLGYYARFLERFPDVLSLARASEDDVLALWSGLGYYSRARNLHRCAQVVAERWGGVFPASADALEQLPGIGRSTASAIAAFCFGERVAIFDANVRRVLGRVVGWEDDLASAASQRALWDVATQLLPDTDLPRTMPRYTQGVMDLGATLCTPRRPGCATCPLQSCCVAAATGEPERFPVQTRKTRRSSERIWLARARTPDGSVWLERRPVPGVWAGLYAFPLFDSRDALLEALPRGVRDAVEDAEPVLHVLTHKDLHLHPVDAMLPAGWSPAQGDLVAPSRWAQLGMPTPVRKMLGVG